LHNLPINVSNKHSIFNGVTVHYVRLRKRILVEFHVNYVSIEDQRLSLDSQMEAMLKVARGICAGTGIELLSDDDASCSSDDDDKFWAIFGRRCGPRWGCGRARAACSEDDVSEINAALGCSLVPGSRALVGRSRRVSSRRPYSEVSVSVDESLMAALTGLCLGFSEGFLTIESHNRPISLVLALICKPTSAFLTPCSVSDESSERSNTDLTVELRCGSCANHSFAIALAEAEARSLGMDEDPNAGLTSESVSSSEDISA
jgi:hypothetical protein